MSYITQGETKGCSYRRQRARGGANIAGALLPGTCDRAYAPARFCSPRAEANVRKGSRLCENSNDRRQSINFSRFSAVFRHYRLGEAKKFASDAPFSDNFRVFTQPGSTAVHPYPVGNRQQWVDSGRGPRITGQSHSMTSLARPRSIGGIVRPSVFAASKLITSLNKVACCTGRSPGEAPLRILSA